MFEFCNQNLIELVYNLGNKFHIQVSEKETGARKKGSKNDFSLYALHCMNRNELTCKIPIKLYMYSRNRERRHILFKYLPVVIFS